MPPGSAGDFDGTGAGTGLTHERDGLTQAGRGDVPSTKRRSVVFEEDDDLDVPDFLK